MTNLARLLGLTRPLHFIDVETTGVLVEHDRVVQVASLTLHPSGELESFQSYVNPDRPIPAEATAIHGITDDRVAEAPLFPVVAHVLATRWHGGDLCAYNGRFDTAILRAEYARAGLSWPCEDALLVDPYSIFSQREARDLTAAVAFYGVAASPSHDAMEDVEATFGVLHAQLLRYADLPRTIAALATYCKRVDPSWLDPDGRVVWRDGEARIAFGKNAGRPLRELAHRDRSFLKWMLTKDFSEPVKALCRDALEGKFPAAPASRNEEAHV